MGKLYENINAGDENQQRAQEIADKFFNLVTPVEPREDVIHRDNIIERIDGIMCKIDYRAVILVGDKGSGKQSIISGYVNRLHNRYSPDSVYNVDFDNLCDNSTTSAEFSNNINYIINVAEHNNSIVLTVNNIGQLLNHKVYGNGGFTFLNALKMGIVESNLRLIMTVTSEEYDEVCDDFPCIVDYCTVINLDEMSKDETVDILNARIAEFEDMVYLDFPENTAKIVCDNADKYIKDRPFPEKALWLMDEICSNVRLKKMDDKKIIKTLDKIRELNAQLKEAYSNNNYFLCKELNTKIETLNKKVDKYNDNIKVIKVETSDVYEVIGDIVGVNMSHIGKDETTFLQKMGSEIKKNVIGQDDTVDKIVKNIIRNKIGLRKSAHSMGNFIFIGSTGVGKTHLAKQIAEQLYGSEDKLIRLDMSEYQSEIDVNKLLGSPPGYIGYKESGQLVKQLNKYPESVVLFDEIEKAHPKIYDVLLQLLDEGFITGSDGNKVDATKSLIIFTSNIGVRQAKDFGSPVGFSTNADTKGKHKEEIIRKALSKRFSPEFLNRLDGICYFNNLDRNMLKSILKREMEHMNENIMTICGKNIKLTDGVENWILDKVEKEENGARPIIRQLQQNIEEELSTMIVEDDKVLKKSSKTLTAHIQNDKIILK